MRIKLVLILFALLMSGLLPACQQQEDIPTLAPEQVVSVVYVYGIPNIKSYMQLNYTAKQAFQNPFHPTGKWAAIYEGKGKWRIQGSVVTTAYGKDYYYATTWSYEANTLNLGSFEGQLPQPEKAETTTPTKTYRPGLGGTEWKMD